MQSESVVGRRILSLGHVDSQDLSEYSECLGDYALVEIEQLLDSLDSRKAR
jgi:hypothetical protein